MPQRTRFMAAMGASLIGTLCFVAAQPRFAFIDKGPAEFAGIAFFLLSGLFWAAYGFGARKEH